MVSLGNDVHTPFCLYSTSRARSRTKRAAHTSKMYFHRFIVAPAPLSLPPLLQLLLQLRLTSGELRNAGITADNLKRS